MALSVDPECESAGLHVHHLTAIIEVLVALEVQEVQKIKVQLWEEAQIAAVFAEAGG